MSYNEFIGWIGYYQDEPFIADRLEIQNARLSLMVAGFAGAKKVKFDDFMVSGKNKNDNILETQEEVKAFEDGLKKRYAGFIKNG